MAFAVANAGKCTMLKPVVVELVKAGIACAGVSLPNPMGIQDKLIGAAFNELEKAIPFCKRRRIFGLGDIAKAASGVASGVSNAANAVKNEAEKAGKAVEHTAQQAVKVIQRDAAEVAKFAGNAANEIKKVVKVACPILKPVSGTACGVAAKAAMGAITSATGVPAVCFTGAAATGCKTAIMEICK